MENLTVDDVYGLALYEAASDLDKVEAFRASARSLCKVFCDEPDLFFLLRSPTISASERRKLVSKVFDGRVETELLNFLFVLINKRRIGRFENIVGVFEKIADEKDGVSKGKIESAAPLTKEQIKRFEVETGKLLQRRVTLVPEVNAGIIGGVRIYVDGRLIDASLRRRLDDLKDLLM